MVTVWFATILSVILVSLISLIGVFFLAFKTNVLSRILFILVGFSAGALFGDVFIHLLPEIAESGFTLMTSFALLAGILAFFVIEKFVQWHHCHDPLHQQHHAKTLAPMNLVGDAFHNFIDGMIIAGSYLASVPIGIATTIAVILHEIPQEIGDFGVLLHSGMHKSKALFYNFLSATAAIIGAVVVLIINGGAETLSLIIPFTAGGFLYIAGADLLPELHKATHNAKHTIKTSAIQLLSLLLGIFIMYLLVLLE